jgi:hypothetical protein
MCLAIAEARHVDEVKDIRDKALALAAYVRQSKNVEAEVQLAEIRLRAERKAGDLLRETDRAHGARGSGSNQYRKEVASPVTTAPKLSDHGITRDQSSKWQKLAAVPDDIFERELAKKDKPATLDGILEAAASPKVAPKPVSDDAVWLWGRMRDFERDGLLDKYKADVMSTMTPEMRADVERLSPRVSAWLVEGEI